MNLPSQSSPELPLRMGCPVWNCGGWLGRVYPRGTPKAKWLAWYSRMFNSVEANSTFYGLPSLETAQRWAEETADGFSFSLKVPRVISHERALRDCQPELDAFLQFASVLREAGKLGTSFLQLSPRFAPDAYGTLEAFLDRLPADFPWAVEVRHHGWFDQAEQEHRLNHALRKRGIDKVIFDSRALFQSEPEDAAEQASQRRKPRTPVRQTVTATAPMLRLVGRNRLELVERFVQQWVPIATGWVEKGLRPTIFTHTPDDVFAPEMARLFWNRCCESAEVAGAQNWSPDALPTLSPPARQLDLFD
ncbi:DUF72 domain-containing protein [Roseiconus nitratireducens]|uniref:DUF72 domain-containing protein n=1 Tax=Roseiconus nitratireducens TaxID=2605748 RepID=UPI0013758676|nr:DUF72 domain-containing protein [Roseiconus nitratireducens]